MKKFVLALAAAAAFSGSALAADLPARTYTKAPMMPEPVANWTGFYIFGGAGGGVWDADTSLIQPSGICSICTHEKRGGDGWFGTVGAGYDWQFNGSWVAGIFADGQFGNIKGTIADSGAPAFGQEKLTATWAAGVRLGYLVAPNVLSYVNGGYTGSNWSGTTMIDSVAFQPFGNTPSFHRNGVFVGGGAENSLNIFGIQTPGWFMKTEYRASYFNGIDLADTSVFPGGRNDTIHFKPFVQTISTSLVYRFNSGGSAFAADLPAQPAYTKAPVMPKAVANWTGFYLFGGAGGGLWDADTFVLDRNTGICGICSHEKQAGDGWFGTVGGGYDWQFNGSWVAGIFADGQFGNIKGTLVETGDPLVGQEKLTAAWAAGVRLGYLVAPNVLSYVNGGYTGSNWSGTTMIDGLHFQPFGTTPSFHRNGVFVGGGVENNLNLFGIQAPGWFMKTEYRASYFNGIDLVDTALPAAGGPLDPIHFKPFVQTISTSLVYRFNSGPVVAKY
jgi:outer membrane immunogenic protein